MRNKILIQKAVENGSNFLKRDTENGCKKKTVERIRNILWVLAEQKSRRKKKEKKSNIIYFFEYAVAKMRQLNKIAIMGKRVKS